MGYTLVRIFQKFDKLVDHMDEIDGGKAGLKCGKYNGLLVVVLKICANRWRQILCCNPRMVSRSALSRSDPRFE